MANPHRRQTGRLHAGRVSMAAARYFVTFVTTERDLWLAKPAAARGVLGAIQAWHGEDDGAVLAATVMPDHVHVLMVLGEQLDVGRCVSRWKALSRRAAGYIGDWQRDFWERRVRPDESIEDYGLYILLNPYRAGLIGRTESWEWFWLPEADRFQFAENLDEKGVPPD